MAEQRISREQFEQVVSVHKGTAFLVKADGINILIAYAEQEYANRREAERERDEAREPDDEFMNELLANAPEEFNGDDDQDDAVRYVRWLESERGAAQVVVAQVREWADSLNGTGDIYVHALARLLRILDAAAPEGEKEATNG